jgi:hypothetical protein
MRITKLLAFLILLPLLLPGAAIATAIVVIRTPTMIIIAADSMGSYEGAPPEIVCKIYQVGSIVYTVSGVTEDKGSGYDLPQVIATELRKSRNANSTIDMVERHAQDSLSTQLTLMRKDKPAVFNKRIMEDAKGFAASFAIAQFINTVPTVFIREFQVSIESERIKIIPHRQKFPGTGSNASKTSVNYSALGVHTAIDRYRHANGVLGEDFVANSRKLIQLEIDDPEDGKKVGGPIDIVRITRNRVERIQCKDKCPKIFQIENPSPIKPGPKTPANKKPTRF